MLELCVAQTKSRSAVHHAARATLNRWQRAGGRSTDQVCRCGAEFSGELVEGVDITLQSAAEGWWPVSFDWLDA